MARSLTSANAVLMLMVTDLFPAPVQIQGFASDDAFTEEAVDIAEAVLGVDGIMSAGYTPYMVPQNIMLQADSVSIDFFEQWALAQKIAQDTFFANGNIFVRSLGKNYTLTKGVLLKYSPGPVAKKTFKERSFTINWQDVIPSPVL